MLIYFNDIRLKLKNPEISASLLCTFVCVRLFHAYLVYEIRRIRWQNNARYRCRHGGYSMYKITVYCLAFALQFLLCLDSFGITVKHSSIEKDNTNYWVAYRFIISSPKGTIIPLWSTTSATQIYAYCNDILCFIWSILFMTHRCRLSQNWLQWGRCACSSCAGGYISVP